MLLPLAVRDRFDATNSSGASSSGLTDIFKDRLRVLGRRVCNPQRSEECGVLRIGTQKGLDHSGGGRYDE